MKKLATLSLGAVAALALMASSASAAFNHPSDKGAAKYVMPLVRAYPQCTAPNDTHSAPLGGGVCSTAGTHSAISGYQFGPKGKGTVTLSVAKKNTKDYNDAGGADSPNDADVIISGAITDLRDPANVPVTTINPALGVGIGGGVATIRITDDWTTSGNSGTHVDIPFPILAPPGQGCKNGSCKTAMSADATIPGVVTTGKHANIEVGVGTSTAAGQEPYVKVFDPTGAVFGTPGIYIP